MKSIAKLVQNFFNYLFGKKSKSAAQKDDRDVHFTDGMAYSRWDITSQIILVEQDDEEPPVNTVPDCDKDKSNKDTKDRRKALNTMRDIIKSEDKEKPLYDTAIAAYLVKAGLDVSRRTVCNYREHLDINSRNERKEDYAKEAEKRAKKKRKKSDD